MLSIAYCLCFQKPNSGIYYKQYNKGTGDSDKILDTISDEIANRFSSGFIAEWMLVVTWQEMEYPNNPNQVSFSPTTKHYNMIL